MSVDILMATYNGEKYLRNQLLSLQQQTYDDWILWVRDDGSTDTTLAILEDFARKDTRIRIVYEGSGCGLGAGKNFLGLTKYSSSEYAIFCDQDDIWFEKKIELLVSWAKTNTRSDVPSLVYCDAYGYSDEQGIITISSVSEEHAQSLQEFLFFNAGYQGCSMLLNRSLCQMAAAYRAGYFHMHDDVVSLLAHTFGVVSFMPKKLMLYRQHEYNVTGNIKVDFYSKLKRVLNFHGAVLSEKHYLEKESFYQEYNRDLGLSEKKLFEAYLLFSKVNRFKRLFIVLENRFSLGGKHLKLIGKTLIRKPLG